MAKKPIYLIANGDLRLTANQKCWSEQAAMEEKLIAAVQAEGYKVIRGHPYDPVKQHGFIDSQKYGIEVFRSIPKDVPIIVAEVVWQYSQHILPGLYAHQGPILTLANWSGTWPGLVGMLNLNGSLTAMGVPYSTIWSEEFTDEFFVKGLRTWLNKGVIKHNTSQAIPFAKAGVPAGPAKAGAKFAKQMRDSQMIMGIFDEGCMGMYNAIIPDHLLNKTGVFKERLSQSALYAKMLTISEKEARAVYDWLLQKGVTFKLGTDEATELTEAQIIAQCKMYIAVVRIADEFGCNCVGIQYQQGLKDLAPASDLVEGLLNNVERPPVYHEVTGKELFAGEALPHYNEVDECIGLDALVTYHLWKELKQPPESTLHDVRWGRHYRDEELDAYVWVFLISGGAPPAHFIDGFKGAISERQPPMYFKLGGGTLKGVAKPGWIVWSRVYVEQMRLKFDTGIAEIVELPDAETEERWKLTTPQWPIMHAVMPGITRDQFMAKHKANHILVAYGNDKSSAKKAMYAKAAAMKELGMDVFICGEV